MISFKWFLVALLLVATQRASSDPSSTDTVLYECDFEADFCNFTLTSAPSGFTWLRWSGSTPSDFTGPTFDHTTLTTSGYYVYAEASSFQPGEVAIMNFPAISQMKPTLPQMCLTFYSHMYGQHIGSLNVTQTDLVASQDQVLFSLRLNQTNAWVQYNVTLQSDGGPIKFKTVRGGDDVGQPFGDVSLDDVIVYDGMCGEPTTEAPTTTTPMPTTTTTTPMPTTTTTTPMPTTTTTTPMPTTTPDVTTSTQAVTTAAQAVSSSAQAASTTTESPTSTTALMSSVGSLGSVAATATSTTASPSSTTTPNTGPQTSTTTSVMPSSSEITSTIQSTRPPTPTMQSTNRPSSSPENVNSESSVVSSALSTEIPSVSSTTASSTPTAVSESASSTTVSLTQSTRSSSATLKDGGFSIGIGSTSPADDSSTPRKEPQVGEEVPAKIWGLTEQYFILIICFLCAAILILILVVIVLSCYLGITRRKYIVAKGNAYSSGSIDGVSGVTRSKDGSQETLSHIGVQY